MGKWDDRRNALRASARAYYETPFPQQRLEDTSGFNRYLRKRDIKLPLEHLRRCGLLVPLVVEGPLRGGRGRHRLEKLPEIDNSSSLYVDIGVPVRDPAPYDLGRAEAGRGLYHPFQLLIANEMFVRLTWFKLDPGAPVFGVETNTRVMNRILRTNRESTLDFARSTAYTELLRLLRLLIKIDPIEAPSIRGTVRLGLRPSSEDWLAWRASQDPVAIMTDCGFEVEDLRRLYESTAMRASLRDPMVSWFPLVRNVRPSELDKLEGAALLAQSLYSIAELLRRFAQHWLHEEWPEEYDVRWGPAAAIWKQDLYGDERVTDHRRDVLRRIVRHFGLDPQPRVTLFVEGETEVGFIKEIADQMRLDLENQGVAVSNLRGHGTLGAKRKHGRGLGSSWFRDRLIELRQEECFPLIIIDANTDAERALKQLDDLLPVDPKVWDTDFEEANFTVGELVAVANACAREHRVRPIKVRAVRRDSASTIVEAISRAFPTTFKITKNEEWGKRLARWAAAHACPAARADAQGQRPIISQVLRAFRDVDVDYRATVEWRRKEREEKRSRRT